MRAYAPRGRRVPQVHATALKLSTLVTLGRYVGPSMIDGATPAHLEPTVGSVASPRVYGDFPERPPGSMVGDDYRIEGRLGAGAMGVVYAATHTKLDRRVALDGTASSTVWPGGGSIVCANQNAWYAGITADSGDEPLIVARGGCDFRCSGCTLRGNPVIAASGDAKVTLAGTSLTATGVVALVHGDSTVAIGQDSEIDATQTALGFSVRGDATLKLVGISFASEIGLSARDRASVFLTRTSITGSKTSVVTGKETTLVEDDVSYAGLTKIRGQRVKDSTGGKTRD